MKLFNYIKSLAIFFLTISLTSCGIFDLVGFDSQEENTSVDITKLPEYAGQDITLSMINESSDIYTLDYQGEENILVLPVCFEDYPLKLMGLEEEKVLSNINNAFFGASEDTGYESVKSYYEKSSYGKLTINGEVAPLYTLDMTLEEVVNYQSDQEFYDSSYMVVEKACDNFKANYQGDITKFDQNKDGYIDGVWVVYMNPYVSDDNIMWYKLYDRNFYNRSYVEKVQELLWAYTYWDFNTKSNLSSPEPLAYCFASYSFLFDQEYFNKEGNLLVDPHTMIHETGHLIGLDDYYSYDYETITTAPTGAIDMMDNNVGDHNSFSKYLLDWVSPKVVSSEGTYHIEALTSNPSCLLIPGSDFTNSPFGEYLLIEYYKPEGLNQLDASEEYSNGVILPTSSGVKVYHIDARLVLMEYSLLKGEYVNKGFTTEYVCKENEYVKIGASNTPSFSESGYRLITLLSREKEAKKAYYYQDRPNNMADNRDLFKDNDQITTFKFNSGYQMPYTITFSNMNSEGVDVIITSNN